MVSREGAIVSSLPSDETISETQRILRKKCIPVLWRKLLNIKVFFVSFD